jgi:hypothetical protein
MLGYAYDTGVLTNLKSWPQRQRLNQTLLTTFPFTVTLNYTVGSGSAASTSAWANVTYNILNFNQFPYNVPLHNVSYLYDTVSVNYTSQKDLGMCDLIYLLLIYF